MAQQKIIYCLDHEYVFVHFCQAGSTNLLNVIARVSECNFDPTSLEMQLALFSGHPQIYSCTMLSSCR